MWRDKIKMIIADVDGTLTDGGVYITENGDEFKKFNAKDGMGMKILMEQGYKVGIISASHSRKMVLKRAEMLGIQYCYVGHEPKIKILDQWRQELGLEYDEIAFVGDDINDKTVMEVVGLSVCPADANEIIKGISHVVLDRTGGEACFREFVDKFFSIQQVGG
ncbi:MAG: HAD-IIIA family hydrolase [Cyclobacteriaceae bacterium]|nr:HAD-IIIA family hydrolase [Cyclobacteriaceae bacterium]